MTIITDDTNRLIVKNYNANGVQPKYREGNIWYKIDDLGYEGLSESVTSNMLERSNFSNFVKYSEENFLYQGKLLHGCKSDNFKKDDDTLVTADRLFRSYYGTSVGGICQGDNVQECIFNFVSETAALTKINEQELGEYVTVMLELDAMIMNDDRHYNNIAFLEHKDGSYDIAPLFDHGKAFMSDAFFYPETLDISEVIYRCSARTFCEDFTKQMEAAEELYGKQLVFNFNSVDEVLPDNSVYPDNQIERVKNIIEMQMEKYPQLFQQSEKTVHKVSRAILKKSFDERVEEVKRMKQMIPAMRLLEEVREKRNETIERN